MVSITHCWKKSLPDRLSVCAWLVLLLSLLPLAAAVAGGIDYKAVSIGEEDGKVLLDLIEEYRLTPTMLEALENGVPLTFVTRVVLAPEKRWFWQSPLAEKVLRRKLRYHPLAGSYEVWDSLTDKSRFFATPDAALVALGDIKGWEVIPASRLHAGTLYRVTIESWHDIGSLPLPLRPKAYLSPGWHLSSKVYEWRLRP